MYLSFSSLYWLTGIWALVAGTLTGLTRIITTQPFDPELMLSLIEQYGVTSTLTAPSHIARLLQSPSIGCTNMSTLRSFYCIGGALAPELSEKLNKMMPTDVVDCYGMSETCGAITANEARVKGSVGKLVDGMVVQIVNDEGQRLGPHEGGEIFVKPQFTFLGYWRDEVATANVVDQDGWLHTGDVGYFDENGFLYLIDRKKDILKYCGYQISPSELENCILRCDGVANVCVVGIPDPVSTDLPAAVIVKTAGKDVTSEEIEALIKGILFILNTNFL